ncbi:Uncharacterised protein [Mycobacterium tuberculosis]|uniref:Uncharacterized protein n=1 Tax=Mycobacterium tuberculosis TaxID=1773 RepID=A0A916LGA5_MYCTX|nr:Uncharacterised protein [Mycobacterium tuberculosis]
MPSKTTVPEVGWSSPSTIRASVDLPDPDSPTIARVLARGSRNDTPSTARDSTRRHGAPRDSR